MLPPILPNPIMPSCIMGMYLVNGERLAVSGKQVQPTEGGTQQGGAQCDDPDRHPLEQPAQATLVRKGAHEAAVRERGENALRDTTSQVDPTGAQHLEGEIPGFGTQDGDEELERGPAKRGGRGGGRAPVDDPRRVRGGGWPPALSGGLRRRAR